MAPARLYSIPTYVAGPGEDVRGFGTVRIPVENVGDADAPVVATLVWNKDHLGAGWVKTSFRSHGGRLYEPVGADRMEALLRRGLLLHETRHQQIWERIWDAAQIGRQGEDMSHTLQGKAMSFMGRQRFVSVDGELHVSTIGPVSGCRLVLTYGQENGRQVCMAGSKVRLTDLGPDPGWDEVFFGHMEQDRALAFAEKAGLPVMEGGSDTLEISGPLPDGPDLRHAALQMVAAQTASCLGEIPFRQLPREAVSALHALRVGLRDFYGTDPYRLPALPGTSAGSHFPLWRAFPEPLVELAREALRACADVQAIAHIRAKRAFFAAAIEELAPAPEPEDDADYDAMTIAMGGLTP